jgi:uncharacterized protein
MSRRALLIGGGTALAGAAFPLSRLLARSAEPGNVGRFGPLVPDPHGILDLPEGFSYRIVQRKGETMSDGYRVPGAFDGMGCFEGPGGTIVLMRNHELDRVGAPGAYRPGQMPPPEAYDPQAMGGVTRMVLDARTLELRSSNLALAGTIRNCAGGMSPWGWLSCEETTAPRHGYVFPCPIDADRVQKARPLPALGRFRHEAACVDPETLHVFLTEDQGDGAFYRFVPESPREPFVGRLQAMKLVGYDHFDTAVGLDVGARFAVEWVDIPDPDPKTDTVRYQARERGAASVRRGEGIFYHDGQIWFTATTGGPADAGQVFRLVLGRDGERDVLELMTQSTSTRILDMPDNLTVAPWGEVFLCEDAPAGTQFVRVLDAQGLVFDFARNALSQTEFAGGCFSPSGDTFFVNLYADGLTLAVRGPFLPA